MVLLLLAWQGSYCGRVVLVVCSEGCLAAFGQVPRGFRGGSAVGIARIFVQR